MTSDDRAFARLFLVAVQLLMLGLKVDWPLPWWLVLWPAWLVPGLAVTVAVCRVVGRAAECALASIVESRKVDR